MARWMESTGQMIVDSFADEEIEDPGEEFEDPAARFERALLGALAAGECPRVVVGDVEVALAAPMASMLQHAFATVRAGGRVALVEADELMSPEEVAKTLGVSRPTVYKMIDDGDLPTAWTHGTRRKVKAADVLRVRDFESRLDYADALAEEAARPATSADAGFEDMREVVRKARATGDTSGISEVLRSRSVGRIRRAAAHARAVQESYNQPAQS